MRRPTLRPRFRVSRGDTILLGPGKADILEAIRDTGSIRSAAEQLGMSYMRAWSLVRTMNAAFREPLVERVRGGAGHGGAKLTVTGDRILSLYREMERRAMRAAKPVWEKLAAEIKP